MTRQEKRRKAILKRRIFICTSLLIIIGIVLGVCYAVSTLKTKKDNSFVTNESSVSQKNDENENGEPTLVSSATVINTGDLMVHSTQLDGAKYNGSYDFSDFFKYIKDFVSGADFGVSNLEVTFGGTESGSYKGYPAFNTPDTFADAIKDCGFDLLLTTNNHAYDTGLFGLKRTVKVLKDKNLLYTGTKESADEKSYIVKDINGINLGMAAYSYENICDTPGRKSLNGNIISADANDLINTFNYARIDEFYSAAESTVENMKNDGAEKIIFYMHWGEEYQLKENTWQDTIAQKLCNLGVDIIIGSHPHVIQPVSLLHSESGEHKTVCIYSMGNGVSNQRQELMNPECTTGHTEDGMLLSYKFDKYSDGTVVLSTVDIIPTWVNKYPGKSGYIYSIIPLDNKNDGSKYGLSGNTLSKSQRSYERTKKTVGEGLTEIQKDLGCEIRFK
ncbi:MAG: CapA family protein [Clostridia bacterium]|nr:CapA family protein [Clostridia bacterium]